MLGACSSGDYQSGPPRPTTTTTVRETTVRAVVAVYSSSARIVTLTQPVAGFTNVVVPTDAEIVRANGAGAGVADLVPRASVEVTGRAGSTVDTFLARRVVLL